MSPKAPAKKVPAKRYYDFGANGKEWKRILKPNGIIAVTELSQIYDDIPK